MPPASPGTLVLCVCILQEAYFAETLALCFLRCWARPLGPPGRHGSSQDGGSPPWTSSSDFAKHGELLSLMRIMFVFNLYQGPG